MRFNFVYGTDFRHYLLSISAGLLIFISSIAHAGGFLSILPEVPLPDQLTEIAESQVDFDTPTGRIIQVAAEGPHSKQAVQAFYLDSLPQLGWQAQSPNLYIRETERLSLEISGDSSFSHILFELSPLATE